MTPQFHPLASQELTDAARFYEQQAAGLGGSFLDEVEQLLSILTMYPKIGQPVGRVRTLAMRRFPYTFVY